MSSTSSKPPPKKQNKDKVKYNPKWAKDFLVGPCNGNLYAFYRVSCNKSVSCSHQGLGNVNEHCRRVTHNKNEQAIKTTRSILSYHQGGGDDDLKKKQ